MDKDEVDVLQKAIDDGSNMDVILPVVQRINHQYHIIGGFKSMVSELESEVAVQKSEIVLGKSEVSQYEKQNKNLREEIIKKESNYEAKITKLKEENAAISQKSFRLEQIQLDFFGLKNNVAQLTRDKSQLAEKLQEKKIELKVKEQLVDKLNEEKLDFIQTLQAKQSAFEAIEECMNKLNSEKEEIAQQGQQYKFDYDVLKDILAKTIQEKSELVAANEQQQKQIVVLQEQNQNLKQQQEATQLKYNNVQDNPLCR